MALSPNYGFPEPDNSSLVKNGAQDIRALGDAIDTFLFRPFTKNAFYNSAFDIWQRGTSFALASGVNTYTADRWLAKRGATGVTVSRQTGSTNSQYCIRVQRDSGNVSTSAAQLVQPFEIADAIQYQGKTVTWSFYARKGADYSPASSVLTIVLLTGTGTTDVNPFTSAYTGAVTLINTTVTLTTSFQRFTVTANIGATVTQFTPYFQMNPTGTAGANDYFEVSNVQLEMGSQATPHTRQSGSIQGESSACMRYYERRTVGGANYGTGITGVGINTTVAACQVTFATPKRTSPSVSFGGNLNVLGGSVNQVVTSIGGAYAAGSATGGYIGGGIDASVASGLAAGGAYWLRDGGAGTAYIEFSSEL
jgi:hypothetical protein